MMLTFLSSCKKEVLAEQKWSWKDHQWAYSDRKSMTLQAADTTTAYQLDIVLDHQETFDFQNLYVRTLTTFPSGKEVTSVVSFELIEAQGGWDGDYGENCCRIKFPLQKRFTFPEVGSYTWAIEPYMRMDTVDGLNSLKVICRKISE